MPFHRSLTVGCRSLTFAIGLTTFSIFSDSLAAAEYPYPPYREGKMDPQPAGWPLTAEEEAYVLRAEHERRPGREANQHLPALWPSTPSAGFWGGRAWLDTHAKLATFVAANPGPVDILLIGDSITQQWGSPLDTGKLNAAWQRYFHRYKTLNLGIGGDKTQNVLWRLEHGGVAGLQPRLIILLIGNNNMFFTPETGVEAAARGIQMCVANLRSRFPDAALITVKIFPAHTPGHPFYEDIKKTNAALDMLQLDSDPKVAVLDLTKDLVHPDGRLREELFSPDKIHLSQGTGYGLYAAKLQPLVDRYLGGQASGGEVVLPPIARPKTAASADSTQAVPKPAPLSERTVPPIVLDEAMLRPTPIADDRTRLVYPYLPYNEGKLDPQLTGWPLGEAEQSWVAKGEYYRKPGQEVQKHLPEMWPVTPTAAHWPSKDPSTSNAWIDHHAQLIEQVRTHPGPIDIVLLGDSLTQGWGGGWDQTPWNAAWSKHFGKTQSLNLGIGGDRTESILWRLDHGALDGTSPKVIVLMIGVNNAPLVSGNGVPAAAVAHGMKLCIESLRLHCPDSHLVVLKILPAFDPAEASGQVIGEINTAFSSFDWQDTPGIELLDLYPDFTWADGSLITELYSDGHLHLSPAGYEIIAARLRASISTRLDR